MSASPQTEAVQQLTASVEFTRVADLGLFGRFTESIGDEIHPTSINVARSFDGLRGEPAKVKVLMADPTVLEDVTTPYVDISATVAINGVTVFTGNVIKATESEDGTVTIELATVASKLSKANVSIEVQDGMKSDELVRQLLIRKGPFSADEVVIDVSSPASLNESITLEDTESLQTKLEQIATYDVAYTYVDRQNRVVYTDSQPTTTWAPSDVVDVTAGGEDETVNRVIVETAQSDAGSQILNNRISYEQTTTASAERGSGYGNDKEEKVTDHSITDQSVASQRALAELIADSQQVTDGTLTIPGDPRIGIYDGIVVPELPDVYDLASGTYTIKRARHKFTATDGYVCELSLAPNLGDVYASARDSQNISDRIADRIYTEAPTPIAPSDVNDLEGDDSNMTTGVANTSSSTEGGESEPSCTWLVGNGKFRRSDLIYTGDNPDVWDQWANCEITTEEYEEEAGHSILVDYEAPSFDKALNDI